MLNQLMVDAGCLIPNPAASPTRPSGEKHAAIGDMRPQRRASNAVRTSVSNLHKTMASSLSNLRTRSDKALRSPRADKPSPKPSPAAPSPNPSPKGQRASPKAQRASLAKNPASQPRYGSADKWKVDVERCVAMLVLTAIHDIMKVESLLPAVTVPHAPYHGYEDGDMIHDHDVRSRGLQTLFSTRALVDPRLCPACCR